LLKLYKISVEDLIAIISVGLKKPIAKEELNANEIKLSYLKRIDALFNKGLHFYIDPKPLDISTESSIFFRKEKFNSDLNLGAKKIVNHFEEFKISLAAISKLADLNLERKIPLYSVKDDAKKAAIEIRRQLYPSFHNDKKEFLKSFITKLAERNILVFEFVETWNKKEKANIDGFFLSPNVIVLKRQQISLRREIFTLSHELGHFLLNEEEIESLDYQSLANINLSFIEKWCNDFAYYFLAGEFISTLESLDTATVKNDFHYETIEGISEKTHLSKIALYTRLLFQNKISNENYTIIKSDFDEKFKKRQDEEKRRREADKENGIPSRGSTPKPITSPLLISTIQTAFYEGVINEYEVCKRLNIKPEKLVEYIQ
jgi:Zn-dependent peptidase ImmA (M78 family)